MNFSDLKSTWIAAFAMSAAMMTACSPEEPAGDDYTYPWEDLTKPSEFVVTATLEDEGVKWAAGDRLYLYGGDEAFEIGAEFTDTEATFAGSLLVAKCRKVYAIYDSANGTAANFSKSASGDVLYKLTQQQNQSIYYGVGEESLSAQSTEGTCTMMAVLSQQAFALSNLPEDDTVSSLVLVATEPLVSSAQLNMSTGAVEPISAKSTSLDLLIASNTMTETTDVVTATISLLPQTIAAENTCSIVMSMSSGARYEYILDGFEVGADAETPIEFGDMTKLEDGSTDGGGDDGDGTTVSVTLTSVTEANTAVSDVWTVACGDIAKAGAPVAAEMEALFGVLAKAVAAGRDITLIFSDMNAISTGLFKGNTDITVVEIPELVTVSNASAFENCTSLRSVKAPKMGDGARKSNMGNFFFSGCSALVSLNAPDGEQGVYIPDTVTSFAKNTFAGCAAVESIAAATLTAVGDAVFSGCVSLTYLEIATKSTAFTAGANIFGQSDVVLDLSKIDLVTGAGNGTIVDSTTNTWDVDGKVFTGFKSITTK